MAKQYATIQDLLDDIDPEFAAEFYVYQRTPWCRLRRWYYWCRYWIVPRRKHPDNNAFDDNS